MPYPIMVNDMAGYAENNETQRDNRIEIANSHCARVGTPVAYMLRVYIFYGGEHLL